MAFTRATIRNLAKESGVEIPKELEDALVSEHLNARNAYAEEQVKAELEKVKRRGLEVIVLTAESHAKMITPVDTGRL